jgi:hypothetical protein
VVKAHTWIGLVLCLCLTSGCLAQRLTAAEVVLYAQQALAETDSCQFILDIEMDTDLIKDSISVQVWEKSPARRKVKVLSAVNPQLQELVFATDGTQSISYSPRAHQVLVGPAEVVRMPSIIERLVGAGGEWIRGADPQQATMVAREREGGLVVYKVKVPLGRTGVAQYWIDARQWWVRQVTYQDEYLGSGTVHVREIQCSSGAEGGLRDEQLGPDIPDGVPVKEVVVEDNRPLETLDQAQMAVPFPLRTPDELPKDTRFSVAYQLDKNIALVYTGEHPFTLVQGPNIGLVPQENVSQVPLRGQQATVIRDEEHDGFVLTWREGGLQFSVAGSLDQEEAVQIAESLDLAFKSTAVNEASEPNQDQGH